MEDVVVYSHGVFSCSVCVDKNLSIEEIERQANILNPTNIESEWEISKDTHFNGGIKTNPCECDKYPDTRKHYLLNC